MKDFIYRTELTIGGPWLIDRDALAELGKIVDDSWDLLDKRKADILDSRIRRRVDEQRAKGLSGKDLEEIGASIRQSEDRWYVRQGKKIVIKLGSDKSFTTDSLSDALQEHKLINEEATGIEIEIGAAEVQATISINRKYESLDIRTSPEREEAATELFVRLREWALKQRAPLWQRVWKNVSPGHWVIWFLCLFFSFIFVRAVQDTSIQQPIQQAKSEAFKILEDGISKDETQKALELLLRIETGYPPGKVERKFPTWFKLLFWVGLVISVVLTVRPKLILGLGKGESKIKLWRKWLKFISITVPGLIFGSFLLPYVVQWFARVFA